MRRTKDGLKEVVHIGLHASLSRQQPGQIHFGHHFRRLVIFGFGHRQTVVHVIRLDQVVLLCFALVSTRALAQRVVDIVGAARAIYHIFCQRYIIAISNSKKLLLLLLLSLVVIVIITFLFFPQIIVIGSVLQLKNPNY